MSPATPASDAPKPGDAPRRKGWRKIAMVVAGVAAIAACVVVRYYWEAKPVAAQTGGRAAARPQVKQLNVVAVVNGEEVRRETLAKDCVDRYGTEVLDSLINKQLILGYCQRKGLTVTKAEIDEEIARVAQHFRIPKDQWVQMLGKERGITPEQYAEDLILPTLAMRKAAQDLLKVTPQELQAAYETQFGPAVEARMIVCRNEKKAAEVQAQAKANPGEFGRLAKEHSDDVPSARNEGVIMPIRKHLGDAAIERVAFGMKPGEVSEVIPVGEKVGRQYAILKCERQVEGQMEKFPLEGEVKRRLEEAVKDKKERVASAQVLEQLRREAKVTRVLGDPQLMQRFPGVAAIVAGRQVALAELTEECIRRHGVEALEGTISRLILVQNCRKEQVQVAKQDIDAEIGRAAKAMGVIDRAGQPDIKTWLDIVQREQGLGYDRYVNDVVWLTAALKKYVYKMSPDAVQVTREDLKKGYEASFGPRAKCKAVVLNNQRSADEVWRLCREKGTNPIFFGQMAAKYSVEAGSKYLNGDVPPIQRHGGRPVLEEQAFRLKEGEMSGIIQVGDKFVILLCLGYTKPVEVKFDDVRQEIYDDLFEKKLRIEMARSFDQMMDGARIENFLANTRQAPKRPLPSTVAPGPGGTNTPRIGGQQAVPRRR